MTTTHPQCPCCCCGDDNPGAINPHAPFYALVLLIDQLTNDNRGQALRKRKTAA